MEWEQKLVLDIKLGQVTQKQEFGMEGSRSKTSGQEAEWKIRARSE